MSFVIVSHSSCFVLCSSWSSRLWFVFALSRLYDQITRVSFKTIKSFCQMISKRSSLFVKCSQNDHILSNRAFWFFSHDWAFYFVLNSCTQRWHSAVIERIIRKTWWWWSKRSWWSMRVMISFLSQSEKMLLFIFLSISWLVFFDLFRAHYDHHFLSVSLKLLCDLLLKTVCSERFHALLKMLCFLLSIVLHQCLSRRIDFFVVYLSFVEMSEL